MKILVTGGAGFIGSNFIRYILDKYPTYKIINLDKLVYCANLKNLKGVKRNANLRFIKGDICDPGVVNKALSGADAIINFAAQTHVDRSINNASEFVKTNVYGTYVLLEAAKKKKISRFLHISTDEVYGSTEHGAFKETDMLHPNSPYAASKAAADHLAGAYFVTYKLPVVITRSSNNFGPYQYPEKVIPLFITNALMNKQLPLYGDGLNIRDWLYVLDNARAIDLIFHKGKPGEIYNVAADNEMDNLGLTKYILNILGRPESLIRYVKDRPGHDRRYSMDCTKLKSLGWRPKYNFQQALKETVNWYQANKEWWRNSKS